MKKEKHYWQVLLKDAQACAKLSQNISQNQQASLENPGFEAQYAAELAKQGLQAYANCDGAAFAAA